MIPAPGRLRRTLGTGSAAAEDSTALGRVRRTPVPPHPPATPMEHIPVSPQPSSPALSPAHPSRPSGSLPSGGASAPHSSARSPRRGTPRARAWSVRARAATAGAFAMLLAALSGCGSGDAETGAESKEVRTVTVFAAAALTEVFDRLGAEFAKDRPDVVVRFNFGPSATLAQQIAQGVPADVFAAAAPEPMAQVRPAAGYPKVFARNRLTIAVLPGNPGRVRKLADLARPTVKVALCAEQAPCGAASAKVLKAAGVRVKPAALEDDVTAALTKVRKGEVDAALVYRTDVRAAGDAVRGIDFRAAGAAADDYPIAVTEQARQPELAAEFVNFVLSPHGRKVLAEAGFETP